MIKIAIVGVGNCASSLVQSISAVHSGNIVGLNFEKIGPYSVGDIEIVAAFDVDARKVGKDVSQAIFAEPNNTLKFADVEAIGVTVSRGPTLDGVANHMKSERAFIESEAKVCDVAQVLKDSDADFCINYLPVGSEEATRCYAEHCLKAGVSFINAIPVFICSKGDFADKCVKNNLVCVGDDIKSQLGATILHRRIVDLMKRRGVFIDRTYQLNVGGNTDFRNMLDRNRLDSKKVSKTQSVTTQLGNPLPSDDVHIGPSDYVPWLKDNKVAYIRVEGRLLGGAPIDIEVRLSVEDSPNSAGIMVDTIRLAKLELDRGKKGYLSVISSWGFKSPKNQPSDDEAYNDILDLITEE